MRRRLLRRRSEIRPLINDSRVKEGLLSGWTDSLMHARMMRARDDNALWIWPLTRSNAWS